MDQPGGNMKPSSRLHGRRSAASRMAKGKARELARLKAGEPPGPAASVADEATASPPPDRTRLRTNYDTERAAYRSRKPDLLRESPGQFVVLVGEELIGPFPDFPTAHLAGLRRFGLRPLYIKQILAEEPVIYMY